MYQKVVVSSAKKMVVPVTISLLTAVYGNSLNKVYNIFQKVVVTTNVVNCVPSQFLIDRCPCTRKMHCNVIYDTSEYNIGYVRKKNLDTRSCLLYVRRGHRPYYGQKPVSLRYM